LPELPISLLWHASYDHDPAHIWLRQTIARIAKGERKTSTSF
jgi:LysR family transcriptional activator of mexEF-oprN operon